MVDQQGPDDRRVDERAELLPEERTAGSEDPGAQAEAILAESDERISTRDAAADDRQVEHRTSEEVADQGD